MCVVSFDANGGSVENTSETFPSGEPLGRLPIPTRGSGFRKFVNYRTAILFFCGRLDMSPLPSSLFAPCH